MKKINISKDYSCIPIELLPIYVLSKEATHPAATEKRVSAVLPRLRSLRSCFLCFSYPLPLCCALHFPDESDELRSEVGLYTVILYLPDEHICLLQSTLS